jgi:hypothetical protein
MASAEGESNRAKLKAQALLLEARIDTSRTAAQVQLKNLEVELRAKHERAMALLRQELLEGGDRASLKHRAKRPRAHCQ